MSRCEIWTPGQATTLPRKEVPEGRFSIGPALMYDMGDPELGLSPEARWWRSEKRYGMKVIASMDESPHGRLLHVSLSNVKRDPSWIEIRAVKDHFFGDSIDAMMVLPRSMDYVNLHDHCFHLWQTPIGWGMQ